MSFPTRERGLKLGLNIQERDAMMVVPYAGTWIETARSRLRLCSPYVVPYAGTWIETYQSIQFLLTPTVVPYAGTWIETTASVSSKSNIMSFPTRERGLKLFRECH